MTTIQKYVCDICGTEYDTDTESLKCEAKGVTPPKAKVGDTVYARMKYPPDRTKPFCRRIIGKVITDNEHYAKYEFDKPVEVALETFIGCSGWMLGENERRATDDDFYFIGEILCEFIAEHKGQKMDLSLVNLTE